MIRYVLITCTGLIGVFLIILTYALLWIAPETELENVIMRTRIASVTSMLGSVLCVIYLFKRFR